MPVADLRDGGGIAAPHARCADDPHTVGALRIQSGPELDGPRELAGEAVADPDREGRRRFRSVGHEVEVGVEGRDLVHLRLGETVLGREGREVPGVERSVAILDDVQVL